MLSLKCDHPLLCEFPILFSRKKVKLGHRFSQLIHKFNIWILKCCSWAVYISKFFSIHKEMGNWDFRKAEIAFPNFSQFTKKFENWNFCPLVLISGPMVRVDFHYDYMWHQRSQFMIKLVVFKKKSSFYNVGNNFASV